MALPLAASIGLSIVTAELSSERFTTLGTGELIGPYKVIQISAATTKASAASTTLYTTVGVFLLLNEVVVLSTLASSVTLAVSSMRKFVI